jgi:hypothetical protein
MAETRDVVMAEPEPEIDQPTEPESAGQPAEQQAEQPAEDVKPPKPAAVDRQLDLCFLCDSTGSMGQYIFAAQQNICSIAEKVAGSEQADVQFALVAYRDHPPQDSTFVTRVFPFTKDVAVMKRNVDTMSASGGGDGPEAVTAALHDGLHLPWRPNAAKIAVLIADAPPHGLEPTGDGFPNGDPEGRDPLQIAREMAAHGITVYTVGCEPALGSYRFARDFMCTLAEITGGQAVALSSAALLADVIINGSAEEISLTMLQREVDEEIDRVHREAATRHEVLEEQEVVARASSALQGRSVKTKQMRTDGRMKNSRADVWHATPMQSLSAAKQALCEDLGAMDLSDEEAEGAWEAERSMRRSRAPPMASMSRAAKRGGSFFGSLGSAVFGTRKASAPVAMAPVSAPAVAAAAASAGPATMNTLEEDYISLEQVSRMVKRKAMKSAA